ncbi:MAG: hypothetical protein JW759_00835 [Candidatus Coatesbacteria bacterium]|nr:hypothetical protein [Candidatus Coatesbacteria bacterium]
MRNKRSTSGTTILITGILVSLLLMVEALAQGPSVELSIRTQKDYYRAGDEFRVSLKAWNPGIARGANLYLWVTGPDLRSYYMPDWTELEHPWVYDLMIPGGFSFGPATIFETTLPDYGLPVWLPGQYQICAELEDASTGAPLAPFAMAVFGVKQGLVEMLYNTSNWVLDVAAYKDELWAASPGGAVRWLSEGDSWRCESYCRFEGLCDTYADGFYSDRFGNLLIWPSGGKGVSIYNGVSFDNVLMDQNLELQGLVTDRDMNLWGAGKLGILFVSRNGEIKWCGKHDGLPSGSEGYAIALDDEGLPVAVLRDNSSRWYLCGYDGQTWWTIPFPFQFPAGTFPPDFVRCMIVDMRDHVWFGTCSSGAIEFDGTSVTQYTKENSGLAGDNVFKVTMDSIGRLWFACPASEAGEGGLCSFDAQAWGRLVGMNAPDVTGVAVSSDGAVFVGSTSGVYVDCEGGLPRLLQHRNRTSPRRRQQSPSTRTESCISRMPGEGSGGMRMQNGLL